MSIIDHFINVLKQPIVSVHDSFIVSVRDTESLILLMGDSYKMHNGDMTIMRGIKGVSQEFSEELNKAIYLSFEQDTDAMNKDYWDSLIAAEGITDFSDIRVMEEDLSDAEVL